MAFVTKLRFQSGDRTVLDNTVSEIKSIVERKGGECKGPHSSPPDRLYVPQQQTLAPGKCFPDWEYTVYTRKMEIHNADHIARQVGHMDFPDSVHVEIEVEQKRPLGHRSS